MPGLGGLLLSGGGFIPPAVTGQQAPNSMHPTQPPAAAPVQRGGVMGLLGRAGSAIGNVATRAQNAFLPTPAALGGLLSPDEQRQARNAGLLGFGSAMLEAAGPTTGVAPSFGQALARGLQAGQQAHQGALMQTLEQGQLANQIGEQRRQQAEMERIQQELAPKPGETLPQLHERLQRLYAELVRVGHPLAQSVAQVIPSIIQAQAKEAEAGGVRVDLGDRVALIDPRSGEVIAEYLKGASPKDPNDPVQAQRIFSREQQLAADYRSDTKLHREQAASLARLNTLEGPALAGNAQAQMALVFAFMKILDPGSVVREGEYALAENTRGVPETVRQQYNRLVGGQRLSTEQVQSFIARAREAAAASAEQAEGIRQHYQRLGSRWGVGADAFHDYYEGLNLGPRRQAPAADPSSGAASGPSGRPNPLFDETLFGNRPFKVGAPKREPARNPFQLDLGGLVP